MKNSTTKLGLLASTLVVLFLIAGNSALGKGLFPFQKPAVNTGRDAQPVITSYQVYIPQVGLDVTAKERQQAATLPPTVAPVQLVSVPDVPADQVEEAAPTPTPAAAAPQAVGTEEEPISPELLGWIDSVKDGEADIVRGIYVEGLLALRVVKQPANNWQYVSEDPDAATQFQSTPPDVTGLLAHNYLAGRLFSNLIKGQEILAIYGDGKIARYQITEIHKYQKLDEDNYYSPFIDQDNGLELSSTSVFNHVYSGSKRLTLQTCLEKGGNWSWGLIFIIATPVD